MTDDKGGRPPFLLVTDSEAAARRLMEVIDRQGELFVSEPESLERVLQIVDSAACVLAIVHVTQEGRFRQMTLIEALRAAKPLLPVLVFADDLDSDLVLAALRLGACDVIAKDSSKSEVRERLRHALERCAPQTGALRKRAGGKIIAIVSARPDADCAIFALHLALAIHRLEPAGKTLLLDLGVPVADSLLFLGLRSSYTFADAVRSTRRFDEILIETAFVKHSSGLALLAMPEENAATSDVTSNDVVVLLNILRTYHNYVVMNLGGMPRSEFLALMVSHADHVFLLCEQTVPSCRSNKRLMEFFEKHRLAERINLVVDRYLERQDPSAPEIAQRLGIPLGATLPASGIVRLAMKNSGRTLFEIAPKDKYTLAIEKMAASLAQERPPEERRRRFGFLRDFFQRKRSE
ncbi:AAA family ATPase [Methylocaldum sp. MU1018]